MSTGFEALEVAIDSEAYEWLATNAPGYLDAVEDAVVSGKSAEEIGRFVRARVGPDRVGLALRCEQAARFINAEMAK